MVIRFSRHGSDSLFTVVADYAGMPSRAAIHTIETPRPNYPFIPETIPTDEPVSVHVLDGDATVLFGTGYAFGAAELLRELDRIGEPDVVVVEHGHPDHYDAVPLLRELYDGLTVAIPAADADVLESIDVTPDVRLQHDDVRWGVRSIHVPGHTPGNMSFLHEPTGTLFAGDTVVHSSSPNAAPGRWSGALAPMKPELNDDDEQARANIEKLTEYSLEAVRLTHGPNVDNAEQALDVLLDDLERQSRS